jgi:PKD repeat protein
MKKISTLLVIGVLFAACKKDKPSPPPPNAGFTFSGQATSEYRLVANDTTTLLSSVTNATNLNWNLGDGRTSTENKLVLSYPKSGVYTVTLTATSKDGQKATISKKVTVLDLVLKNITINKVFWNTTDPQYAEAGWPLTNTADVYVKIQQLQGNDVFQGGFAPNAPVVYTSPVLKNIPSVSDDAKTINVSSKIVLNKASLVKGNYLISLIAKNTNGEYVLFSNLYSGSEQLVKADDLSKNIMTVRTSFFSSLDLNFDFE